MSETPDYTPKSNEAEWHITYKCDLSCVNYDGSTCVLRDSF